MPRDPRAYLWDVLDAVANVEAFVRHATAEDYARDVLLRSAVERQFEIIGEALNQLSRTAPDIADRVPESAHPRLRHGGSLARVADDTREAP